MIYDLERVVAAGDRVVSIYRVRATARHTGIRFDQQAAYVLSFRDGRIAHVRAFLDPDTAFKAVGLAD
jgi:ketosteroid isomerase-like protein